jgi:hypothetical protein
MGHCVQTVRSVERKARRKQVMSNVLDVEKDAEEWRELILIGDCTAAYAIAAIRDKWHVSLNWIVDIGVAGYLRQAEQQRAQQQPKQG